MENIKILSIDPSTSLVGYSIILVDNNKLEIITSGIFKIEEALNDYSEYTPWGIFLENLVKEHKPEYALIENYTPRKERAWAHRILFPIGYTYGKLENNVPNIILLHPSSWPYKLFKKRRGQNTKENTKNIVMANFNNIDFSDKKQDEIDAIGMTLSWIKSKQQN